VVPKELQVENMEIDFLPSNNIEIDTANNIPDEDLVNFELTDEKDEHYQPVPSFSKDSEQSKERKISLKILYHGPSLLIFC
jgi:hypothetical protein